MGQKTNLASDAEYFLTLQTQTGWGRVLARFEEWIGVQNGWLALDVGCGPGLLPGLLANRGALVFGVDHDPDMFFPTPLHPELAVADVFFLPFPTSHFDLISASNLLFLLPNPAAAVKEMCRALKSGGRLAMLNPSAQLTVAAATELADQRGLTGITRDTLLNWAIRAESHFRWSALEIRILFEKTGLNLEKTETIMGPGFAHLAMGTKERL